jgi:hypothetical protein
VENWTNKVSSRLALTNIEILCLLFTSTIHQQMISFQQVNSSTRLDARIQPIIIPRVAFIFESSLIKIFQI